MTRCGQVTVRGARASQPEIPLALAWMVKIVLPVRASPDGSVIPDVVSVRLPPLVNVGFPARVRLTVSADGLYETVKPTGLLTVFLPFLVNWSSV